MPRDTAPRLSGEGADVEDVRDLGMGSHADDTIFNHAQREQRVVITRGRDFAELAMNQPEHSGVTLIRSLALRSPHITTTLIERLKSLEQDALPGSIVVIELGRMRIRKPPKQ